MASKYSHLWPRMSSACHTVLLYSIVILMLTETFLTRVESVDRGNFKKCNEASFCRRLRNAGGGTKSPYIVSPDTLEIDESAGTIQALIVNTESEDPSNPVKLRLELFALEGDIIRFKVNEAYPIKERAEVPYALIEDIPPQTRLKIVSKDDKSLKIQCDSNNGEAKNQVVLTYDPFKIEFYMGDRLIISANSRGLFTFEHMRNKSDQDVWEETYKSHRDSRPNGPTAISMDFTFENFEHIFGLPEHADSFDLDDTSTGNGEPYRLYNLDVFQYELKERMALYAAVPFVMAHKADATVGMLWLNAAETWVDVKKSGTGGGGVMETLGFGSSEEKVPTVDTHWISESGIVDTFIMLGKSPKQVSSQYAKLTGVTPLPPFFSLGYHQCKWNYRDEADVAEVNAKFDEYDIPADVIWLDIEHTDGKRYFTWDPVKFSTSIDMINNVASVGRKMVTIVDPHIKVDNSYYIYKNALDADIYVKREDGSNFEGWCWPGNSAYADFFLPKAREFFAEQYKLENYKGSTLDLYTWNDMNEPSVFNGPEVTMHKDAVHNNGLWEHRDVHNAYGHVNVMATHAGHLARSNNEQRPFVLSRSGFAGTQRYAAIWTGDNAAEWGHLKASIPMCLSLSISGISFVGADVGGFFGNPDAELMMRWYQTGAFQPFFRSHAHLDSKRREPWLFGEPWTSRIRAAIRNRYTLLPFWYALFYENEQTGVPPMRPLFFEFPEELNLSTKEDEYMVGNALLVRPVTDAGATSADVFLPKGALWYNYFTGKPMESGVQHTVSATLDEPTPVFQRGGTIVPTLQRVRRSSKIMINDPYTLIVALDGNGKAKGNIYIDDGQSFKYRKGANLYMELTFENGSLHGSMLHEPGYKSGAWLERVIIYGYQSEAPKSVKVKSITGSDTELDSTLHSDTKTLVIKKPAISLSEDGWSISIQ